MHPAPAGSSNASGGGAGGGGGLPRLRSAPATWLLALLEEEEEDPLKQNQNLTQLLTSNAPSSRNSAPFNASSAAVEPGLFETGGGFHRQNSSPADFIGNSGIGSDQGYFSNYGIASNYEYMPPNMEVSPSGKRARELELQNPPARYPPPLKMENQEWFCKGAQTGPLRASSLIEMEMDKLLEESVPCKIRAKRGCATHPRSIAERVRRTRISDRIRKLQELVPDMDKQTNTADMLEEAVDYVKFLQRQIQELTEQQRKCKCMAKE